MDILNMIPCPFCHGRGLKIEIKSTDGPVRNGRIWYRHSASVRCNKCHARGPTVPTITEGRCLSGDAEIEVKNQAIKAWNNR